MDWPTLLITNGVTLILGLSGTFAYFRPKLKEANAKAEKADAEAENYAYNALVERLNQMEKRHNEEYNSQSDIISKLRQEVLTISKSKYESDKRILQLENENKTLRERYDALAKEFETFRNRVGE